MRETFDGLQGSIYKYTLSIAYATDFAYATIKHRPIKAQAHNCIYCYAKRIAAVTTSRNVAVTREKRFNGCWNLRIRGINERRERAWTRYILS